MESMNEPAEMIIYENLKKFIKYRNIKTNYKFLALENFSSTFNTLQYEVIEGTGNDGHIIYIFLIQPKSKYEKKTDEFKKLINRYVKNQVNIEIIYITENISTSYINKKIIEYNKEGINIYPYTYEYFIIVLPESDSSFKHEIITEEEFAITSERLLIVKENLPKIDSSVDPQLVWIGAKRGNIVKITGKSETAQEVEEFRLVI